MTATATALTAYDRLVIDQARGLAALPGIAAFREHTNDPDTITALATVVGEAKFAIGELLAIIDRLAEAVPAPPR